MVTAVQTKSRPTKDQHLLLNRSIVMALKASGLADLCSGDLFLGKARRLGLWSAINGTDLYLLSLISAAMRQTIWHYFNGRDCQVGTNMIAAARKRTPFPRLPVLCKGFLHNYPRHDFAFEIDAETRCGTENRSKVLTELFLLDVLVDNPSLKSCRKLFDDAALNEMVAYRAMLQDIAKVLLTEDASTFPEDLLQDLLRAPLRAAPLSLQDQLGYILKQWGNWLSEDLLTELQVGQAITREESQMRGFGPGPTLQPVFGQGAEADLPAAFTKDTDWMMSSVLLAKSIYVWLGQLSQRYRKRITTLRDIPEEELAELSQSGFNALWLIGIWERSRASRTIKQLSGNPEAEASAYALHSYRVASELGGDEALAELEVRCQRHGIRLACDVVPNHTGIDSEWILRHPDWFLQTDQPPYPGYRFTGPDLCHEPGLSIRIEDGYWDHADAAVVFEYLEHESGRRRYIYHGNDGTHMPWNDTAQLNFLLPEVRQAMSDLIVQIARRFRLIRFDAAMTLARKHYRRLWFPPPGGSAGVPSRSAFWMTDVDFDRAFPGEFWREVVVRINTEAPDTLLIAEAFWLMESYFVRTLGMHRVYNSAFMNMLKREENAKYRRVLKETLAYNPEVLKRYVNFMNNPDEATAVAQFGKGDKYFGVAVLLATLPGLPMFGHGQVEGFEEKYGMEYRRAYWNEVPDTGFIDHHRKQVFPLLRRRQLFAGVEHFQLYDFATDDGIDDNVFAFSNGAPGNRWLVIYNNADHPTSGRVHQAAPRAHPDREGLAQAMAPLAAQLEIPSGAGVFCRFRNLRDRQESLRTGDELQQGLDIRLGSYQYQVFYDFRVFQDHDQSWASLHSELAGRPVADLDVALLGLRYRPLWQAFQELTNTTRLNLLVAGLTTSPLTPPAGNLTSELDTELEAMALLLRAELTATSRSLIASEPLQTDIEWLNQYLNTLPEIRPHGRLLYDDWLGSTDRFAIGRSVLAWWLVHRLGKTLGIDDGASVWTQLGHFGLNYAWREACTTDDDRWDQALAETLVMIDVRSPHPAYSAESFSELVRSPEVMPLLGVHEHAGDTWFNRERMAGLCGALVIQSEWLSTVSSEADRPEDLDALEMYRHRLARAAAVGYRLDNFLSLK